MRPRRFGAAVALAMLVLPFTGGPALGASTVREAVVSTLRSDGTIQRTTVAQLVHLRATSGKSELRIPTVAELDSYRNLSGFRGPSGEGRDLVWRTGDRLDATALARFDGEPPLAVAIRYFLDGKQTNAEDMKRRTGRVRIEIDLENVSGEPKTLRYKAVTSPALTSVVNEYIPMEYVVRVEFPTDRWSDVGGAGVSVLASGGTEVASASGVLSPPVTAVSKTLSFEARSDDILTPRIQIFAVPGVSSDVLDSMEKQFAALKALYGGAGSIEDNLTAIYEGAVRLADGTQKILDGVGSNDESTGKPVIALDDSGLPTTVLGTLGFLSNALFHDVLPGLGTRDSETGKGVIHHDAKGAADTLLGSLQSQKNTFDEKLVPGMKKLIGYTGQISDGIGALLAGLETDSASNPGMREGLLAIEGGLGSLVTGLQSGDPADPGLREGLLAISSGMGQLLTGLQSNDLAHPGFYEGLQLSIGGLGQVIDGLKSGDPSSPGAYEALTSLSGALGTFFDELDKVPDPASPADYGFRESLLAINAAAEAGLAACPTPLVCGAENATGSLTTAFATINAFVDGLVAALGQRDPATGVPVLSFDAPGSCGTSICPKDAVTAVTVMRAILDGNPALGIDPGVIDGLGQAVAGLGAVRTGLNQLAAALGTAGAPSTTIIGGVEAMAAGMSSLIDALGASGNGDVSTVIGGVEAMLDGTAALVAGLGQAGTADANTVIGALELMYAGLANGPGQTILSGMSNPDFNEPQAVFGGKTPKEYYKECPGCFDPDQPKLFDPKTNDPMFQPGFLEVFELFSEGIHDAIPQLDSFDAEHPGLVDGLKKIAGGLGTLAAKLQTFDPSDPGLVDGLEQVRSGLQQVDQGLFAVNELGVRTMRGEVGDQADGVGRDRAGLSDAASAAAHSSVLGGDAQLVSATYVFDLPAQKTAASDNARRGALIGSVLAGSMLLALRMRRFGL